MKVSHNVDSAGGHAASKAIPSDPQHVSREDREAFVSRFEALDTDGSKVLEKDEYQKAAVSKFMSYDDARTLVTKDSYLTQSDFTVARARHEQAKGGVAIVPPSGPGTQSKPANKPSKKASLQTTPQLHEEHNHHHAGHAHGLHGGAEHTAHAAREGDIRVYSKNASGHIGPSHGRTLNMKELDSIGETLGLPSAKQLVPSLEANKAYNPRQTAEQKLAGAYLALSTAAKFETLPPSNFTDQKTAAVAYGNLKVKAMEGDAAGVRKSLKEHGGTPGDLSDEQLTNLWSGNEHQNLHGVMFGNPKIYNAIHATSLNDNDKTGSGVRMGGFNDRGEHPQWGWFEDAQSFNQLIGIKS